MQKLPKYDPRTADQKADHLVIENSLIALNSASKAPQRPSLSQLSEQVTALTEMVIALHNKLKTR